MLRLSGTLRMLGLSGTLAILVSAAACSSQSSASSGGAPTVEVPTDVRCADAAELRQRADSERSHASTLTSDQARVSAGSRASFFASLGLIADLDCSVTSDAADEALRSALDAARNAAATGSFYEASHLWNEATFEANRAASFLIEQLPPPPSR